MIVRGVSPPGAPPTSRSTVTINNMIVLHRSYEKRGTRPPPMNPPGAPPTSPRHRNNISRDEKKHN